ncbi:MAG: hypothetical protein VB934_14955 [Polyangiaceae bacterium]
MRWPLALSVFLMTLGAAPITSAVETAGDLTTAAGGPLPIDRTAVRWHAPATGGVMQPQFVSARMLAFLARLEALIGGAPLAAPAYDSKHVRLALQRHITEVILANLPVDPEPKPKEIADYAEEARKVIERQIAGKQMTDAKRRSEGKGTRNGRRLVAAAAVAEGIDAEDLDALLLRRARASWYLDKMVAPMLEPSTADLVAVQRSGQTPYTKMSFAKARSQLHDWFLATRLAIALDRYYRNVRSTVRVKLIMPSTR